MSGDVDRRTSRPRKDRGFDAKVFVEMLNRLDRLPRASFPLDDTRYEALHVAVGTWQDHALVLGALARPALTLN